MIEDGFRILDESTKKNEIFSENKIQFWVKISRNWTNKACKRWFLHKFQRNSVKKLSKINVHLWYFTYKISVIQGMFYV